ncbi:MAG: hypothetical protein ACRDO1_05100 [Nocardioidaceae bacterium]
MPTTYKNEPHSAKPPPRRRIAGERSRPSTAEATAPTTKRDQRAKPAPTPRPSAGQGDATLTAAGSGPRWWLWVVAALLLVALLVEATLLVRARLDANARDDRAQALQSALRSAPASAEKAAVALLSYDHAKIDDNIAATTPLLTKKYAADYTKTMESVVAPPAKETKAVVTAEVLSSGVVDVGAERTDVLVFVNQTTESAGSKEPVTALNRAVLTMVKQDGAWVVSDLKGL